MQHQEIIDWLRESAPIRLDDLWRLADQTRQQYVGGEVHLRGLIELSNYCVRLCGYCGLRAGNAALRRYRMTDEEVMASVRSAVGYGYGTVVLQSGEDPQLTGPRISDLVRRIKRETPLAVTLSLGERTYEELASWREAGADRYLLRFETSNRRLYDQIHPPRPASGSNAERSRFAILEELRRLGYEVGSGVMIGIPGQTYDDLANDIELFARLDLDMIGVGPYLRHPDTPLADRNAWCDAPGGQQVPADETTTYKVIALARLVCPRANIPATTALATLNRAAGRELGLERGANVVMPNLTPQKYRALYEIYPDKACIAETGEACHHCLTGRIRSLGRQIARGRGDSPNHKARSTPDNTSVQ
ncbi:MAG: [FeFe] hydrogenase H-cluster radical SAM maturase HydE [Planctomycetaceae bacterium]|nr:[FeFe] hydrogenase H-cluster radical SAM maturase HydE [Planctomycetaceae bacterium]